MGYITSADNDRFISALFQKPRIQEVVEKAISQLNEANYDAALKLLDEIVSLLPQDVSEILYLRAKMKLELNQKAEAIADLDAAIEIEDDENSAQRVANLALRSALHGILEDYDKALLDIEKAISICMEIDDGGVLLIILCAIRRKVQEGLGLEEPVAGHDYIDFFDMMVPSTDGLEHLIAIYDLTIKIDQSIGEPSTDDYLARGIMYVEIDEPEAGIADLTRVIEANPTCVKAYLARGKAYRKINQSDDSLNDFRKAIEICGDTDYEQAEAIQ